MALDFPSHHLPVASEYEYRNCNEDDRPQFQDALPLGSPVEETQLCNLDFDTELLYDSDCGGDGKMNEPPCEYEEEMVLDSEDEEINGSRLVTVTKSLPDNKSEKRPKQLCAGTEVLKTSFGNEKVLHGKSACERELVIVRLNNETSQELEEWSQSHSHSQAEALGLVDHFVSINKVGMSQEIDHRKTRKEKSPAVPSAEGPRNLARRFHQKIDVKENWKFEFIDNDPLEGLDSFRKERSCTSHPTDVAADDRGYMSLGNEGIDRAGILSFDKETKDLSNLDKRFEGRSSKYGSEITQVYEAANEVNSSKEMELAGKPLEASDMGSDALEIYDIGFNTQIAAEAIEALAYGNPFGNGSTGGCQDMDNNVDGSLRGVTENNARLKLACIQAGAFYDIGAILGSAKRKKRSDRRLVKRRHFGRDISNFSKKQSGIEELDPELKKSRSVLRSRLSAETKLCGRNSAASDETSGRSSAQPIKQSEEEVLEMNNHMISATPIQNIPPINEQSRCQAVKVSPFAGRTGQQESGVRLNKSEDRSCTLREKMSDKIDQGALVYKRMRSRLNAYPFRVSSMRGKGLELCYSSEGARKSMLNTSSKSDMWNCPKGQRTSQRVGKHSNRTIDLNVPFNSHKQKRTTGKADMWNCPKGQRTSRRVGKHSNRTIDLNVLFNSHKQKRTTGKANLKEKGKSASSTRPCVPWNSSRNDFMGSLPGKSFAKPDLGVSIAVPSGSECITSVAVGVEKDHTSTESSNNTLKPSGSDYTTMSSKTSKNVVPSNNTYSCHQKRPCNKNLPKTSLLKELINLGFPKQIPEFRWKESRRRRDMAHVRVLFSQHLDDDIIKQQRKVVARLGTSIVSCSMDATHFIADKFARTKNMLEAIALGKPVVTHLWLESCAQANCFIDEKNYILRDAKKEKEFGFSMPVSLARANQHPLLKGRGVFVTPNIKPEKEMIINLVRAVHGQPLEKLQISSWNDENIPEGLLILSCEEDHSICLPFLKKGSAIYSSELLLNGVVTQKLEYKRHQLFANDVKRNCS